MCAEVAFVAHVAFVAIGITALCVSQVYIAKVDKEERDRVIVNLTHKIIAYCFPIISGIALTTELVGSVSTIAAIVCGVAASMLLGAMMYEPIGRDWNK
jgi:mannitol-specific phosphotransferase system IIBC component